VLWLSEDLCDDLLPSMLARLELHLHAPAQVVVVVVVVLLALLRNYMEEVNASLRVHKRLVLLLKDQKRLP